MIMIVFVDGQNSLGYPLEASERDTELLIEAVERCHNLAPGETAGRLAEGFAACQSLKVHPVQQATPLEAAPPPAVGPSDLAPGAPVTHSQPVDPATDPAGV